MKDRSCYTLSWYFYYFLPCWTSWRIDPAILHVDIFIILYLVGHHEGSILLYSKLIFLPFRTLLDTMKDRSCYTPRWYFYSFVPCWTPWRIDPAILQVDIFIVSYLAGHHEGSILLYSKLIFLSFRTLLDTTKDRSCYTPHWYFYCFVPCWTPRRIDPAILQVNIFIVSYLVRHHEGSILLYSKLIFFIGPYLVGHFYHFVPCWTPRRIDPAIL